MFEILLDGQWQRRTIVQSDDGYFYTRSRTGRMCGNYPTRAALLQMYQDTYAARPACPRRRP